MFSKNNLAHTDPELYRAIQAENQRQEEHIELIASENYVSPAVLEAQGKQLFAADCANVQPHSGSQANQAVYMAVLQPGDAILGMSLAHGGHLTHGASVNMSGKLYRALGYGLNAGEEIDYDEVGRLAAEHQPKVIVAGASAYSRVIDWRRFRDIADSVGARLVVDMAHYAGLIAVGIYPSPVGSA